MATGGGWRIQKGYEGQKFNVKRFAYDVLYITLSKCGFPRTHLRVDFDQENDYGHPDYVITVHSAVMCIALSMRDKWKRMFEYKQMSSLLNNMQKVEEFLADIEVLPDFRADDLNKIKRSLAFYSELILFLHSINIEVDFEKLLDIWSDYFNKKIAVKEDSDILLVAIFIEDPDDIVGYLRLVGSFIQEFAIPYGRIGDVSRRFRNFSGHLEEGYEKMRVAVEEFTRELLDSHLEFTSHYLLDPPSEAVEESVSFLSEILERDSVLSGSCTSTELPGHPQDFILPSSSERGTVVMCKEQSIIIEETFRESEVGDTVLPGHRKSPEPPSEMATGGRWRIQKGYEGQKYNVKRFAYDVLYITLSKCGFPRTHLRVDFDQENDYGHPDYVITVHSAVMCIALGMRDKWKSMFEYKQMSSLLNNMQKVEEFLADIEVLPDFRADDLNKIKRSLAFYSELILFLHSINIEVDFEKLLDIWSRYFSEKIAIKEDSDVLLEAIFIKAPVDIVGYLRLVGCFIQEFAIPYGKIDDVSRRFRDFSGEVEEFYAKPRRLSEILFKALMLSRLRAPPHNLLDLPPEPVEESVSFLSAILGNDSVLPGDFPLPTWRGAEDRLEQMNLGSLETPPESEDETPK